MGPFKIGDPVEAGRVLALLGVLRLGVGGSEASLRSLLPWPVGSAAPIVDGPDALPAPAIFLEALDLPPALPRFLRFLAGALVAANDSSPGGSVPRYSS